MVGRKWWYLFDEVEIVTLFIRHFMVLIRILFEKVNERKMG